MDRIVRVDLRWPPKPVISASARDLICQVLLLLVYVCSRVHDILLLNAFNKWNATNTQLQSKLLAQANIQCAVRDPDWWLMLQLLINANCVLVMYAAPCQGLFSTLAPPESAHTSMDSEQCWFYWGLRKLMTKQLCGVHEGPLESPMTYCNENFVHSMVDCSCGSSRLSWRSFHTDMFRAQHVALF